MRDKLASDPQPHDSRPCRRLLAARCRCFPFPSAIPTICFSHVVIDYGSQMGRHCVLRVADTRSRRKGLVSGLSSRISMAAPETLRESTFPCLFATTSSGLHDFRTRASPPPFTARTCIGLASTPLILHLCLFGHTSRLPAGYGQLIDRAKVDLEGGSFSTRSTL